MVINTVTNVVTDTAKVATDAVVNTVEAGANAISAGARAVSSAVSVSTQAVGQAVNNTMNVTINGIKFINAPVTRILEKTFSPPTIKKIDRAMTVTSTTSATVATGVSLGSVALLNPIATPEILLIPFRLWSLILTALGIRKKIKPWGTVYDSVTKQPLDPVYVSLINLEGEEITSSITDIDGRYGFLVPPGVYKVIPRKTNYIFPSDKLSKHFNDELYQDLYFGDYLNISEEETIAKNIPMDAVNFDWNEFAKNKKHLYNFYSKRQLIFARISNYLFNIGAVVAVIALFVAPQPYNLIIFILYVFLFGLRKTTLKKKAKGKLKEKSTGEPMSFALVRIFSAATNVEIAHKVADKLGHYLCLIPNGNYYVQIEKKNLDESYSVVFKSEVIEVKKGILNQAFEV